MVARKTAAPKPPEETAIVDTPSEAPVEPAATDVADEAPEAAPKPPEEGPRPLRFITPQGAEVPLHANEPSRLVQPELGRPLRFGGNS